MREPNSTDHNMKRNWKLRIRRGKCQWRTGAYQKANDEVLIVSLQVRLDVPRVQRKYDNSVFVAKLPLQSIRKLDGGELALRVQVPRVLFLSHLGVGDPVVFDGRLEVVLHGGRDPDDSAGICGGSGRDEQGIEKPDEEEVAENVGAELEIEPLSGELVNWWDHHSSVRDQHVQLGLLSTIRRSG